jgi:hypothetical protein
VKRATHTALALALVFALPGCNGLTLTESTSDAGRDAARDARSVAPPGTPPKVDVLTQHNDVARTGQNLGETILTPFNVTPDHFGKLFTLPIQGLVYAQPLVVSQYTLAGATRDVLIVATAHNLVYAFDASTEGAPLWTANLGPTVPNTAIAVPCLGPAGTQNIQVEIGILSTPVVDRSRGLVYVTNKTWVNQVQQLWLHAIDLASGADAPGSPIEITATVPGNAYDAAPTQSLDAPKHAQRPGLLLQGGVVYLAFASHQDCQPYHGWILGYRYDANGRAFTQTAVFNTTADGTEGGIWQSGQGLLSDGASIYAVTANGALTAQNGGTSYGESFLKLSASLAVEDWFAPVGFEALNHEDFDLGSGGPVLLPGSSPSLMVGGGKAGVLYVVDTSHMGHLGVGADTNLQEWRATSAIFGAPAVWTGGGETRLYLWGVGDVVREFALSNGLFATTPVAITPTVRSPFVPGGASGILSVSSNGSNAATGILWAVIPTALPDEATVPGTLYAFDAITLRGLWDSNLVAARDALGNYAKFVAPTVANGKVYMATGSQQIAVYGLLGVDAGTK